jgi:hypothetical protein
MVGARRSPGREFTSAIRAHLGSDSSWQWIGRITGSADGKSGHELFNISLAYSAVYIAIMVHHHFIESVATILTLVFIYRHGIPPEFYCLD